MPITLLSIFLSLLPARWRGYWLADANLDVHRGAVISSALQFVICGAALWLRYPAFLQARLAQTGAAVTAKFGQDRMVGALTDYGAGFFTFLAYLIHPLSLLLFYLMVEGVVRIFATVAADDVLPSLPLQLIDWSHRVALGYYHEAAMGPRIPDLVEPGQPGKYDLKIVSCRSKDWNALTTIKYEDQMYELLREETGQPPRPFVYLLSRRPEGKIIRGLHHYQPEETLQKSGWAPLSTAKHTREREKIPL